MMEDNTWQTFWVFFCTLFVLIACCIVWHKIETLNLVCEAPVINLTCELPEEKACVLPELVCNPAPVQVTCPSCKYNLFLDPIEHIANRDYEYGVYDCTEMSRDAIEEYKKYGFKDMERVTTELDCNHFLCANTRFHDLVAIDDRVYISVDSKEIIPPKDYPLWGIEE